MTILPSAVLGLLMIYSATRVGLERNNLPASFSMERQMIFVAAGLILVRLSCRSSTTASFAISPMSSMEAMLVMLAAGLPVPGSEGSAALVRSRLLPAPAVRVRQDRLCDRSGGGAGSTGAQAQLGANCPGPWGDGAALRS